MVNDVITHLDSGLLKRYLLDKNKQSGLKTKMGNLLSFPSSRADKKSPRGDRSPRDKIKGSK